MTGGTETRAPVRSFARRTRAAALLFAVLLPAACAGVKPAVSPPPPPPAPEEAPPPDPFLGYSGTIRQRARAAEAGGDRRKALFLWKVVREFAPGDAESGEKVRTLSEGLARDAEAHFRKGTDAWKAGDAAAARREFLLALANEPGHAGARDFLKVRLGEPDVVAYETRGGDTLRRIAKERYNDPDKDGLIAWFNDLERGAVLRPGTALRLPVLESPQPPEGNGRHPKDILSYPRENDQAEAERFYRNGLKKFQAGELEKAAAEWEKALRVDPDHAKARKDLERVRRMLEKLK